MQLLDFFMTIYLRKSQSRIFLFIFILMLQFPVSAEVINRLVVPFPAGGAFDQLARALVPELSARTGQAFIVENRPGAEGMNAIQHVQNQSGKGQTLLLGASFLSTGQITGLFKFDFSTAFKPVIQVGEFETLFVTRASGPITDLNSLRTLPVHSNQSLSCGAAIGQFVWACELMAATYPRQWVVAPFPGEPQVIHSLLGGHIDVAIMTRTSANDLIKSGQLRVIASAGSFPAKPPLDSYPLLKSHVSDLEISSYIGLFVTSAEDDGQIVKLNMVLNEILQSESFVRRMEAMNVRLIGGAPSLMRENLSKNINRLKRWRSRSVQ